MKFYLKITSLTKAFQYGIIFSETPLAEGELGKGDYLSIEAKDEEELKTNLKDFNFRGLTGIVNDPIGE